MAPSASKHTAADMDFLDASPHGADGFSEFMFAPAAFLDGNAADAAHDASSSRPSPRSGAVRIKSEGLDDPLRVSVKAEPQSAGLPRQTSPAAKVRTTFEGGRTVLELLFDSDESDIEEVSGDLTRSASRSSIFPSPEEIDVDHVDGQTGTETFASDVTVIDSDDESDSLGSAETIELIESDTLWQDPITSYALTGTFRVTQKVKDVVCIEYVNDLPSIYPMFRERTVIVVDITDSKFDIKQEDGRLYTVDFLIRNADNDPWHPDGSGRGSSTAMITFVPGAYAGERIESSLIDVVRYELDPASRDAILSAQANTRRSDGTTPEQNAAIFKKVICDAKCNAVDSNGNPCRGAPMMKAKPGGKSRGHQYFIACSGWTPNFKENHRTHSIPDHVDENLLAKALAGQPLFSERDKDTQPCSRPGHPRMGLKQQY
ncbi:hypothetical protein DFH09DRAFT_1404608 [Mycena vulgaris]|nr:hypothetical protein DFH09DRAFT_1404608 [Mycena vulgaris]